jgi:uncharacterized protein YceK
LKLANSARTLGRKRTLMKGFLVMAAMALSGCATIATLGEPETKNKVFSGTIRHFELACGHGQCVDFPFSLIADTVILPATIPWSIINVVRDDDVDALSK